MERQCYYDKIISRQFRGKEIQYGMMFAPEPCGDVLLIKVGQNGSIFGFKSKYKLMSDYYRTKNGVTVIVSSNPFDGHDSISQAIKIIDEYYKQHDIPYEEQSVRYFGHSNGALAGAWYGYKYAVIKNMLLLNMPVIERFWDMTENGIQMFTDSGGNLSLVYGEKDPYCGTAREKLAKSEKLADLEIQTIEGADHHFTDHLEEFRRLPDWLFQKASSTD